MANHTFTLASFDGPSFAALTDLGKRNVTISSAEEIFNSEVFRSTEGHPQYHDFMVHHKLTRETYFRWLWRAAHQDARLQRGVLEGTAEESVTGHIYSLKVSAAHLQKMIYEEMADVCPG